MEAYKSHLANILAYDEHKMSISYEEETISYGGSVTINRNEEGKLNSRYLDDRYEPAVRVQKTQGYTDFYLFDGEIKDCSHPFYVLYVKDVIVRVVYYSSERIMNNRPIVLEKTYNWKNKYYTLREPNPITILEGYESGTFRDETLDGFSLQCEEMDKPLFKFAD